MRYQQKKKKTYLSAQFRRFFLGGGSPKTMQFLSLLRVTSGPNFKEKTQFVEELSTEKENV